MNYITVYRCYEWWERESWSFSTYVIVFLTVFLVIWMRARRSAVPKKAWLR